MEDAIDYMNTLFGPVKVETKRCSKCDEDLPLRFYSNSNGGNYTRTECRKCARALAKQIKEYKKIPVPSDHVCPICLKTEEQCRGLGGKKVGTWCVDHDHKTGEFRGWLCHACNRTIGNFHEDTSKMERAIQYLEGSNRPVIEPCQSIDVFLS